MGGKRTFVEQRDAAGYPHTLSLERQIAEAPDVAR